MPRSYGSPGRRVSEPSSLLAAPPATPIRSACSSRPQRSRPGLAEEQAARQARQDLADGLARDARQLVAQGRLDAAQDKLGELRQISPDYPGLAELAAEVARRAQSEREYAEIVRLTRQARERAVEFVRRTPGYPDPERVLKLPTAISARSGGGAGWAIVWVAGLTLIVGSVLGFWAIPGEGRWAWGAPVLFSGLLGDSILVPWVAIMGAALAAGLGTLSRLVGRSATSRVLGFAGGAVAALSLALTVILAQVMGVEGSGPTLVLVGQVMLGVGLLASAWRRVQSG